MLSKRVIPCLDVHDGRTVKGINFVDLIDAGDPVEQAKIYNDHGADEVCFLDISATNEGRKTLLNIVSKVAESCFIPLTVGGGIKDNVDINNLLKSNNFKEKDMSEVQDQVKKIVIDHLGIDESKVTPEAKFIDDLGADSLDTVELVMAFEEKFGIEIPDDAAETIQTVQNAIDYIESKK